MFLFFFFNDTATTEIYTLSLHDALPISLPRPTAPRGCGSRAARTRTGAPGQPWPRRPQERSLSVERRRASPGLRGSWGRGDRRDRKSTRLNSSHSQISYAVFCLTKKTEHLGHLVAVAIQELFTLPAAAATTHRHDRPPVFTALPQGPLSHRATPRPLRRSASEHP